METITAGSTAMTENRPPRRRPAAPARLHHLEDFTDDDGDQQQDGRGVDQQEGADDVPRRLNRRQAGQNHEGEEGRQQCDANGKRRQQPPQGQSLAFGNRRIKGHGRGVCARHSEKMLLKIHAPADRGTDAFISQCCRIATFPRRADERSRGVHRSDDWCHSGAVRQDRTRNHGARA
jgi:hypothetical protein